MKKWHSDEVEAMEVRYTNLKTTLESPRPSTPNNERVAGGKREFDKLLTEMSFLGKWLQDARKNMTKRPTTIGLENIAKKLPWEPSVRSLQDNWKRWGIPIKTGKFTRKKYVYDDELETSIKKHETENQA